MDEDRQRIAIAITSLPLLELLAKEWHACLEKADIYYIQTTPEMREGLTRLSGDFRDLGKREEGE